MITLPPKGSHDTDPFVKQDKAPKIKCEWCGQVNKREREQCRGYSAPLPE
jgi:hypothetical protein